MCLSPLFFPEANTNTTCGDAETVRFPSPAPSLHPTSPSRRRRWVAVNVVVGGAAQFWGRVSNPWPNNYAHETIMHFLVFDPPAAANLAAIQVG